VDTRQRYTVNHSQVYHKDSVMDLVFGIHICLVPLFVALAKEFFVIMMSI